MKRRNLILAVVTLGVLGSAAAALVWLKSHQHLGQPGVKCEPRPDSVIVDLQLPVKVGEFDSTNVPEAQVVTNMLPPDTSLMQRCYFAEDGFWVNMNLILMGEDRTSIHKPDYCLPGQGWQIVKRAVDKIPIRDGTKQYELPISHWSLRLPREVEGKTVVLGGIYLFWFVTKDDQTPIHMDFMRTLGWHLLTTGELQRWAYVSYFATCSPDDEDAAYQRMKNLIAGAVPEFQFPLKATVVAGGP